MTWMPPAPERLDTLPPSVLQAMPGLPYFGAIGRMRSDPLGLARAASRQGALVLLGRLGRTPFVQVNAPELVKQVLTAPDSQIDMTRDSDVLQALFNKSVFMLKGNAWRFRRDQMQPAFRAAVLPHLFAAALPEIEHTAAQVAQAANHRMPVAFDDMMRDLVQRMIVRMMFGVDFAAPSKLMAEVFDYGMKYRQRRRWALVKLPMGFPTPGNWRFAHCLAQLNASIADVIGRYRAHYPTGLNLLTMLMEARDEKSGQALTDQQLLDEVKTVFNTGYVTTATAAVWLFDLLARHAAVESELHAELHAVCDGAPLAYEHLQSMPYLDAVIAESLRLYPPGWLISRRVVAPLQLGGCLLRPRTVLIVSPYSMHRDPRFWDQPEAFLPARFLVQQGQGHREHTYFPFGLGPRVCIGRGVALMELKALAAVLLRRFRFQHAGAPLPEPEALSILRRGNGLPLLPLHR